MNARGVWGEAHKQIMEKGKAEHDRRESSLHDETVEDDDSYNWKW